MKGKSTEIEERMSHGVQYQRMLDEDRLILSPRRRRKYYEPVAAAAVTAVIIGLSICGWTKQPDSYPMLLPLMLLALFCAGYIYRRQVSGLRFTRIETETDKAVTHERVAAVLGELGWGVSVDDGLYLEAMVPFHDSLGLYSQMVVIVIAEGAILVTSIGQTDVAPVQGVLSFGRNKRNVEQFTNLFREIGQTCQPVDSPFRGRDQDNLNITKLAEVYKRDQILYLHSSSKTTAGVWMASLPYLKVDLGAPLSAKGDAILQVLDASREGVPHPTDWSVSSAPFLEFLGVKSWERFMRGSLCVDVKSDGTQFTFTPYRNLGSKEGFKPVPAEARHLPHQATPEQIGLSLEEVLRWCERDFHDFPPVR